MVKHFNKKNVCAEMTYIDYKNCRRRKTPPSSCAFFGYELINIQEEYKQQRNHKTSTGVVILRYFIQGLQLSLSSRLGLDPQTC